MKKIRIPNRAGRAALILTAAAWLTFAGTASTQGENDGSELIPIPTESIYMLTAEEVQRLKRDVEQNEDVAAAFRLYQYYHFSSQNREEVYRYLTFCAVKGDAEAQYNLACLYHEDGRAYEAKGWALRAKANGVKNADALLKKIESGTK